ncbi:MAG: hypothetical protein WC980_01465 [Candidatus Brocadiia bacterium]
MPQTTKWPEIESHFGKSKKEFGKKINFVKPNYKRTVIFRDIDHAFGCYQNGFYKPAVVLAGGVLEEVLRCYLESKGVKPENNNFVTYIKTCETRGFLKRACAGLGDSVRGFRNLVHINNEEQSKHAISKSTALGAISAIFTVANDF